MIRKCIAEVQKRLVISNPHFCIKVVTKDGISVITAADPNTPKDNSTDVAMDSTPAAQTATAS